MDKKDLLEKLKRQGHSSKVLDAFDKVDRLDFISSGYVNQAYEDIALPIGSEQTISQPSTIAFMLDLLDPQPRDRILEVGSGSGYVLALLSEMVPSAKIFGTERVMELYESSRRKLKDRKNVAVEYTPKQLGLEDEAPFDRILASASASELPKPLIKQLEESGILVCPVINSIIKAEKTSKGLNTREYFGFTFVKLYEKKLS